MAAAAGAGDPQGAAEVEYIDSWGDIAFIGLCRIAYGNIAGWQSSRRWAPRIAFSFSTEPETGKWG